MFINTSGTNKDSIWNKKESHCNTNNQKENFLNIQSRSIIQIVLESLSEGQHLYKKNL